MADNSYPWGESFQIRLLVYLIKDPEQVYDLIEPQFFTSPIFVEICRVVKEALKVSKNALLSKPTLKELLRATVGREDSWPLYKETLKRLYEIELADKQILRAQAFEFARESRYREALEASEKDVSNRRYERVHQRIEQLRGFGRDAELGLEYWAGLTKDGIKTRWTEDRYGMVGTGLRKLDNMMGGGPGAGELGIVLAGGKVGKTTMLANFAAGAMSQRKNVAIASGELSALKYRKRIDGLISGIPTRKLHRRNTRKKVLKKLLYKQRLMKGQCYIKAFPSGKASIGDIEAWMTNLDDAGIETGLLIVDYLFLFQPNNKTRDRRLNIGQTAVELRGIGMERDIPVWTASQGNRAALSKTILGPKDFAEDISQFWTLDFLVALCQSKAEAGDPESREPQKARAVLASARDVGSGGVSKLYIDRESSRVTEGEYPDVKEDDSDDDKGKDPIMSESSDDDHHKH